MFVLKPSRGIPALRGEKHTQDNMYLSLHEVLKNCFPLFPPPGGMEFRKMGLPCDKADPLCCLSAFSLSHFQGRNSLFFP